MKAFEKGIPTAIIIDTPFQLLCAMEAIHEFEIKDYLIVAALDPKEQRNCQVLATLDKYQMNYQIEWVDDYYGMINSCLDGNCSRSGNRYERVIVGNYNAFDQWATAVKYGNEGASLLFLDDGGSTISILRDGHGSNLSVETAMKNYFEKAGFDSGPYFFTIFSDVKTKTATLYANTFSHLIDSRSECANTGVYIIGTNPPAYCSAVGISQYQYEGILWQKLSEMKDLYKNVEITYIPHGRDSSTVASSFCHLLNIKYEHLNCAVESFFAENSISPVAVYGFGSTALFSIKRIFPSARVINWFIDNTEGECYRQYKDISIYYKKNGIVIDVISFPSISKYKKMYLQLKHSALKLSRKK